MGGSVNMYGHRVILIPYIDRAQINFTNLSTSSADEYLRWLPVGVALVDTGVPSMVAIFEMMRCGVVMVLVVSGT